MTGNGIGMTESYCVSSLGYRLINLFVDKLKGKLNINTQSGTDVHVIFIKHIKDCQNF